MIPSDKTTPEQQAICDLLPLAARYAENIRVRTGRDDLYTRHTAVLDAACRLVGHDSYLALINDTGSGDLDSEDGA